MSDLDAVFNAWSAGPLISGPLHGECGETDAHIWAQARDEQPLTLRIFAPGGDTRDLTLVPSREEFFCMVFHVDGLQPGERYEYSLLSAHGETPRFGLRTALSTDARRARIALGSCYKHYREPELPIFGAIAAEAPDAFLMLGDTCYFEESDWGSEPAMVLAHLRNRNHPSLRPLIASVPTLGVWDDHDFGPNDSDGTFAHKARSLRVFRRMWAQRGFGLAAAPGVFSSVRIGPAEVFLLDSRSLRHERGHILGEAQLAWLLEGLGRSTAPVKLIGSGSQLLPEWAGRPPYNWECWRRDAPGELAELQRFITQRGVTGVIFLSGDPHLGHLLHECGTLLGDGQQGPDFFELTSSPLANRVWSVQIQPGESEGRFDRYLVSEIAAQNYGVIDIDLDRAGAEVVLALKGTRGEPLCMQPVSLDALATRPARPKWSAAVIRDDRAYVFRGDAYVRCDPTAGTIDAGYPKAIAAGWHGAWPHELGLGADAVLASGRGKLFFFKGNGYTRYDLARDHADAGYPRYIGRHWNGVWPSDLDAVLAWPGDKAYFFKGRECIRYDLATDRAEPGYPRPIADEFPGTFDGGIDAALAWTGGKAYLIRGEQVARVDTATGRVDDGYPRALGDGWLGFLG